jgi:G:T-mismatch repair DNA endonuclease (very short patch repair protein)
MARKAIRCRFCRNRFVPYRLAQTCDECRNAKPFCRCGCGLRVLSMVERKGGKIAKYLPSHNVNLYAIEKGEQLARGRDAYWKNLTKKERLEVKKRNSEKTKKVWASGAYDNQAKKLKDRWENLSAKEREVQVRAARSGARVKPNRAERRLNEILSNSFPGEFRMNVLGKVIVDGRVPDFVNVNGKKVLVELFGNYWHGEERRGHSEREEERERKSHFKKWGFKTAIVWERDLKDEKLVEKKVRAVLA